MRPWRALGMVRKRDFEAPDYRFLSESFSGDEPVLEGRVHEAELQAGLWMHCAEVVDLHSMVSRVRLDAGLRIVVVLAGQLDVSIGGHRLQLRADDQEGRHASAAIVAMPRSAMFERRWERGKWERKLTLHFTSEWLQGLSGLREAANRIRPSAGIDLPISIERSDDVHILPWRPSPYAIALAEQLMLPTDDPAPGLSRLRQTSRAMEFLHEALTQFEDAMAEASSPRTPLRPRDHDRMLRLRAFLDSELQRPLGEALTVSELGRRYGLSNSALQRQFRQAFGRSIDEYRRSMRLHRARADLERGMSIAQAAERAGYTSPANFATAFRRQFSVSPKDLRAPF